MYHQINGLYIGTSFVSMVRLSKVVSTLSKRQSITSFAFFVIFYVLVILFVIPVAYLAAANLDRLRI